MLTVKSEDLQGKLQVSEVANDFKAKVNMADSVIEHHSTDAYGGELLVIYVAPRKVATDDAGSILASELRKFADSLPSNPLPELPVTEVDKAVIDQPVTQQPTSGKKAAKKPKATNGPATEEGIDPEPAS